MTRSSTHRVVVATVAAALAVPMLLLLVVLPLSDHACAATTPGEIPVVDGYTPQQLAIAHQAIVTGRQRGINDVGVTAALMAAAAESNFRNLANPVVPESLRYDHDGIGTDYDSVGPWQMRASVWGVMGIAKLMDPAAQVNWFYDQLVKLPGWQTMAPDAIAQAVENSNVPDAYGRTRSRVSALLGILGPVVGSIVSDCRPAADSGSGFGARILSAAARWIGTPYVWGGGNETGPTNGGFDCSGLVLYAVFTASSGRITLPHYTQSQQDDPRAVAVPFESRQPGDLIYFTAPGATDSHHVAIYAGQDHGADIVLQAPASGIPVGYARLDRWKAPGERLDVRRISDTAAPTTQNPQAAADGGGSR